MTPSGPGTGEPDVPTDSPTEVATGSPPGGASGGEDAAAAALARARATARSRGLRPGRSPALRRVRDVPADARRPDDGRDPHLLGDQLEHLLAERGWQVDVAVGSVMGRWPVIVGPEVAQHCSPVTFEDGVLTVRAESTAWATQIRLLASTVLARLEEEAGPGTVTELRVTGPSAPSWSRGPRRTSDGRGPRDTYG
jgi:predicted nucleic acid-binding Zn ribbon protein